MYWTLDQKIELLSQKVYELPAVTRFIMYLDCDYVTAIYDLICNEYMKSQKGVNESFLSEVASVLKSIVITAVGAKYTKVGVILSVFDILMFGFSQSDALELAKRMEKYALQRKSMKLSILVIHPMTIEDNYFELDNPYSRDEEYKCEVQDWDSKKNDNVQGEKYFKGKFTDMKRVAYIYQKEEIIKNLNGVIQTFPSK